MTLTVDDELIARASELTGVRERTALVRMGLEALIARKGAERLARLGGTEKKLRQPRRRRAREAARRKHADGGLRTDRTHGT